MSIQTYQKNATRAESPREVEYRLMGQVTRALMDVQQLVDNADAKARVKAMPQVMDALDWNRRMWSTFSTACVDGQNGLPDQLRANIVSLSIFVSKHSSEVVRSQADIETLVDINKSVMQGLAAHVGGGAGASAP